MKWTADEIFSYDTVKIVRIKDWRIGVLHWLFIFIILMYTVVWELLWREGYKKTVTPQGYIRLQTERNWQAKSPSKKYYVADVERASIWVDHAAIATALGFYGSSRTTTGTLVNSDDVVQKDLNKRRDIITIHELLKAAGTELDSLTDSTVEKGRTRREVGMVMLCIVEYTNMMTWGKLKYKIRPRVLEKIHFRQDQEFYIKYPDQRARWERYGIRIIFITGGVLGGFVFQQALISVVSGLALLAVSTAIVDFLATKLLPQRETYNDCKYQPVEIHYDENEEGFFGHATGAEEVDKLAHEKETEVTRNALNEEDAVDSKVSNEKATSQTQNTPSKSDAGDGAGIGDQ